MRHVACDGQTKAATDHVAQKIQKNVVEIPIMEAQLFQQLEPVNDATSATATTDFRPAKLHCKDAAPLEADIANLDLFTSELLLGRCLDDRGAGLAAKQKGRRVRLGIAADQQNPLAHLGHHVAEVGEGERLADAALSIDGNDLGVLGGLALRNLERRLFVGFVTQTLVEVLQVRDLVFHCTSFQSRIILRQPRSEKAVS